MSVSFALFPVVAALVVAGALEAGDAAPSHKRHPQPEQHVTAAIPDSLRFGIRMRREVRPEEPVPITLRVENVGSRPLDLYLRGRTIAFDLVVSRPDGTVIWRRLHDEMIPAILRLETLAPGAALELEDVWDQRSNDGELVTPGDYLVHGELLSEEQPLVTPAEPLRISDR